MKTTYLLKDDRRKREGRRKNLLLLFSMALLFIFGGVFHRTLAPSAVFIFSPLLSGAADALQSLTPLFAAPLSKGKLLEENLSLKRELAEKNRLLEGYTYEAQEVKAWEEIFGKERALNSVRARVIARAGESFYDTLLIAAGEREGIRKGDSVFVGNSALGVIDEVYGERSRVKFFSSPGEEFPVFIGTSKIETTAFGKGGGNFEARLPRGVSVNVQDAVILPDSGAELFGVVEEVESKPSDTFQRILFKMPINIAEVWAVEVRLKKTEENNTEDNDE